MSKQIQYDIPLFRECVRGVFKELNIPERSLEPAGLGHAFETMKPGRSAGECLTGKFMKKDEVPYMEADLCARLLLAGKVELLPATRVNYVSYPAPRGKEKVRTVYAVPTGVIANERRWFMPFELRVLDIPIDKRSLQTGYSWFKQGHASQIITRFSNHGKRVALDASFFDGSQPEILLRVVFEELGKRFAMSASDAKTWESLTEYYCCPTLTHGGVRVRACIGVMSGYMWTHFVDCLLMLSELDYIIRRHGGEPRRYIPDRVCYGDDIIALFDGITLERFLELAEGTVHMSFSREKSSNYMDWLGLRYSFEEKRWNPADPEKRYAKMYLPVVPDTTDRDFITRAYNHVLASGNGIYSGLLISGLKAMELVKPIGDVHFTIRNDCLMNRWIDLEDLDLITIEDLHFRLWQRCL
jgi:hypothetical protein